MKKIIAILIVFVVFASCKKLEDLNKNIKDPETTTGESLFTGAQKAFVDVMATPSVGENTTRLFVQYWAETQYLDEENYNLNYRKGPDGFWNAIYVNVLNNLNQASNTIKAKTYLDPSPVTKQNKLAIVDVMSVYAWSLLVEAFGNIPYTQALDINNKFPKYDDGLTVYKDLISRLNADIATLNIDQSDMSFGSADNIYQGSAASWYKFANSLKLRMGMLLADVDPTLSKATVEAAAPNAFTSTSDNAFLVYSSASPNQNPIYEDQVASSRHDYLPANTLVDAMNTLKDPRRPFYFTPIPDTTIFAGAPYGIKVTYPSNFSQLYGSMLYNPNFQGTIFEYSEVEFLLAEAVERGYSVSGTAETHYDNAITASINYWEAMGGVVDASADVAAYLAQPSVAYTTATGTWKQKIGTQQWIAYYNRGLEGWTEWRRLDYPVLSPATNAVAPYVIPIRYTYPIEEQTLNGSMWAAAASAIGGDAVNTKLFWDKY